MVAFALNDRYAAPGLADGKDVVGRNGHCAAKPAAQDSAVRDDYHIARILRQRLEKSVQPPACFHKALAAGRRGRAHMLAAKGVQVGVAHPYFIKGKVFPCADAHFGEPLVDENGNRAAG